MQRLWRHAAGKQACPEHKGKRKHLAVEILVCQSTKPLHISDGPSRLDCTETRQLGSEEVKVDRSKILENLLQCAFPTWGEHGHTDLSPTALKKGAAVFRSELSTVFVS